MDVCRGTIFISQASADSLERSYSLPVTECDSGREEPSPHSAPQQPASGQRRGRPCSSLATSADPSVAVPATERTPQPLQLNLNSKASASAASLAARRAARSVQGRIEAEEPTSSGFPAPRSAVRSLGRVGPAESFLHALQKRVDSSRRGTKCVVAATCNICVMRAACGQQLGLLSAAPALCLCTRN